MRCIHKDLDMIRSVCDMHLLVWRCKDCEETIYSIAMHLVSEKELINSLNDIKKYIKESE